MIYTRNVHSIDTALCEDNYELLPLLVTEKKIISLLPNVDEKGKKKKDKEEIHFTNFPQTQLVVRMPQI